MEEKIERILLDTISADVDGYGCAYWYGAPEAAAEIAKQIEAIELSWADKVEELTDAWHSRLAKQEAQLADKEMSIGVLKAAIEEWQLIADEYMAQLAEMRECLKWLYDHHAAHHTIYHDDTEEYSDERMFEISDRTREVLAAVPEVAWSGGGWWAMRNQ